MSDDDSRRFLFRQIVVRIKSVLIFGEIVGFEHFPNVVIECAGADEQHISSDFVGHFSSQISHLHRVHKGALRHFRQTAQNGVVDVAEFHECHGRCEAEDAFDEIEQGIGEEECHTAECEVAITLHI